MHKVHHSIPGFLESERRLLAYSSTVGTRRRLLQIGFIAAVAGMIVLPLTRTGISMQHSLSARFQGLEAARQIVLAGARDVTGDVQSPASIDTELPTAGTGNARLSHLSSYFKNLEPPRIGLSPSPLLAALAALGQTGEAELPRADPGQFRRIAGYGPNRQAIDFSPTASVPTAGERLPPLARPHGIPAARLRAIAEAARVTPATGGFETQTAAQSFTQVIVVKVALVRPAAAIVSSKPARPPVKPM